MTLDKKTGYATIACHSLSLMHNTMERTHVIENGIPCSFDTMFSEVNREIRQLQNQLRIQQSLLDDNEQCNSEEVQ